MTRIVELLNIIKSVVERSYQIEFAGVDKASAAGQDPGLFGGINSPIVIYRAALFTEVKDAYAILSKTEKHCINSCVKKNYSGISTLSEFIDNKVGGPDGLGACLQDATFSLLKLHSTIIKELELNDECKEIDDNIDAYRKMPKLEISGSPLEPEKRQGEEDSNDDPGSSNCAIS